QRRTSGASPAPRGGDRRGRSLVRSRPDASTAGRRFRWPVHPRAQAGGDVRVGGAAVGGTRAETVQQEPGACGPRARSREVHALQAPQGLGHDPAGGAGTGPGSVLIPAPDRLPDGRPSQCRCVDGHPQCPYCHSAARDQLRRSGGHAVLRHRECLQMRKTWWKRLALISMLGAGVAFAQTGSTSGGTTGSTGQSTSGSSSTGSTGSTGTTGSGSAGSTYGGTGAGSTSSGSMGSDTGYGGGGDAGTHSKKSKSAPGTPGSDTSGS